MKYLTTEYNKTEEFLKQCVLVVEQLLSAVDLCSKYETYEDKLLLYPLSTAFEANCAHDSLLKSEASDTQQVFSKLIFNRLTYNKLTFKNTIKLIFQDFADNYPLRKFLRIVSKVSKDVMNLKHSMRNLINESNQLKCSLKLYMNEVSRPNSDSKQENISTYPVIIDVKDFLHRQ